MSRGGWAWRWAPAALLGLWLVVGGEGQGQAQGPGGRGANPAPGATVAHPLFTALTPPAWLDQHVGLTVLAPAPLGASLEPALSAALLSGVAPGVAGAVLAVSSEQDVSPATLADAARSRGHTAAVSVALTRVEQRVTLRALYLDLRSAPTREHRTEVSGPLDAFLARFVGAPPPARASAVRARSLRFNAAGVLDLEVLDLDDDGRAELLVARATHLSVYQITQTGAQLRVARRARVAWPAAPLRVPVVRRAEAFVSVQAGRVVVSRSDREGEHALSLHGDELQLSSTVSECPGGHRLALGCARWVLGRDYFGRTLEAPAATVAATVAPDRLGERQDDDESDTTARAPRFYARSVRAVRQASGEELWFDALVTPSGALVGSVGGRRASVGGQGAALATADVDADGALDILSSDYTREGQPDRMRWFRLTSDGRLAVVWESPPVPGAVLHAAAGDLLGTGRPVFVAFEARQSGGSRLWVVD